MTDNREIQHLKELWKVKQKGLKRALKLQAKEYERRLEDLNHAHAQARAAAERTVSQDVYTVQREDVLQRIISLRETIATDVAKRAGRAEVLSGLAVALSILLPLIAKWIWP